ncbi:MAG: radical SAM protein, partial [Deltaproteobacteria bacterium]|nr:radical SAM protein [Deltaproteobacteria bacterium]
MKFLLVDPPHKIWEFLRAWMPSPACLQLAAYLENNFDMEFMDCTIAEHPWRDLQEKVKRLKPDVVGCTYFVDDTLNAAKLVKEQSPESLVIVGGGHPSLVPEKTLQSCKEIDYVCVGEGEITLHEFLTAVENKNDISKVLGLAFLDDEGNFVYTKVLGLAFLDDEGNFVYTGDRPMIENLDILPMPAYHLYDMEHPYVGLPSEGKRGFLVNFSRGCSFTCKFCSEAVFWKNKWRSRSPEKIGEEFELLKEKYNRHIFYVGDNIFNLTRERGKGFIKEMLKRKTGQKFWLQSRADLIIRDEDLMEGFKEAGVYQFMVGIEHSKQNILDDFNKGTTIDINTRAMQILKKHGLMIMATIMMGLWDETEKDRTRMMRYLRKYVDHLGLNIVTPYPGTQFYEEMDRLGRIKVKDFS